MLEGVAVVWMPVQDIERAKGFYRDTLGLQITNEDRDWAEVDANGLTLDAALVIKAFRGGIDIPRRIRLRARS